VYGRTAGGGTYNGGTVFSLTTAGKETVVHSFGEGGDGKSPTRSNLTPLDGALFGTTYEGGSHGHGIVFKVLQSSAVQTLYNFGDNKGDGAAPAAGVIAYRNALYGTTDGGGANKQGTIFRVTPNGEEFVLYSLSRDNGTESTSRLLLEGANMYGTLSSGGAYREGTAFRFTP
jgi:uncharacterized repeat protein (TIGR03803 family)